jgi:hypothetical protein
VDAREAMVKMHRYILFSFVVTPRRPCGTPFQRPVHRNKGTRQAAHISSSLGRFFPGWQPLSTKGELFSSASNLEDECFNAR